ncbi:eCIS core domain-containing protein [Kitasatospora aureofaciens]|uniref:eCIS core domain-containing protein n=1 Tax=Kitasatospora aureofaciens TaxID=1894 RepID=UPI0036F48D4A
MHSHQPDRRTDPAAAPAATRAVRPGPGPRSGTALALQRSIGNAAVARLVQRTRHGADGSGGSGGSGRSSSTRCSSSAGCSGEHGELPLQRSLVHQVLRTAGQPLDASTRHEMECRLGADFSDVRLHTGSTARASAAEVGARAYTSGNHVVLGAGGGDRHTLAHELTHVIQQRSGPVAGTDRGDGLRVSDPSDRYEREAEANAVRALAAPLVHAGAEAGPGYASTTPGAAEAPVQRMPPTLQRMPPKRKAEAAELSEPSGRTTRGKARAANLDLNRPVLEFTSEYEGPATQRLDDAQSIGFQQVARLRNPPGAPQQVATNYHFWQEVKDSNVQIVRSGTDFPATPSSRPWMQDGPYRPPYNNAVINSAQNMIEFNDNPGFSTSARMTAGYWLRSYQVSFRWKVAHAAGPWSRTMPAWTSPEVTHTLHSEFDPEHPDQPSPIVASPAGDFTWNVDLSG